MKRLIAAILRNRSSWQLVAIAVLCTIAGLAIVYTAYSSTLKKIQPLLLLLFATGGAALVLAMVRRARDLGPTGQTVRGWLRFLAVVFGLAGLIAFVTYSFGHYRGRMVAGCNASLLPPTLAERRAALAAAEAGLRSPFALLPGLYDDIAARECERSRRDLARVDQGLCTRWPLVDRPCTCGEEPYPGSRCSEPTCMYAPGLPDRFDCPGDTIPPGYLDL